MPSLSDILQFCTQSHAPHFPSARQAQLAGELAVAADEAEKTSIKAEFDARERILEHELDHTPRELSMALTINCARLLCPFRPHCFALAHPPLPPFLDNFLSK